MSIAKKRADEIRAGMMVDGDVVEYVHEYGPMYGEETGYARHVEIHYKANPGWMIGPRVGQYRGDTLLSVWQR